MDKTEGKKKKKKTLTRSVRLIVFTFLKIFIIFFRDF